jgi:hypothetical protein
MRVDHPAINLNHQAVLDVDTRRACRNPLPRRPSVAVELLRM